MGTSYDARKLKPNIIVFGGSGKGKSSLINLLANQPIAKVGDGAYSCTEKPQCYEFATCNVWDTCGYPDDAAALAKTLRLVRYLKTGVSLLIMVISKGRVLEDAVLNYRAVYEFMCATQVPSMLAVTRCETDGKGSNVNEWVNTNRKALQQKFPGLSSACICGISTQFQSEYPGVVRDAESSRELLLGIVLGVLGMNVPPFVYRAVPSPKVTTPMLEAMMSSVMGNKTDTQLVAGLIKAGMKRDDAEALASAMETPDAQYFNRPAASVAAPASAPATAPRPVAQSLAAGQPNGQSAPSAQGARPQQQRPIAATEPATVTRPTQFASTGGAVSAPATATAAVQAPFAPTRVNSSPAGAFASENVPKSRSEQVAVAPVAKPTKPQNLSLSPAAVSGSSASRTSTLDDPLLQPSSRTAPAVNDNFYPSVPSLITGSQGSTASRTSNPSMGFGPTAGDVRFAPAKEERWDTLTPTRAVATARVDDFVATTPATAPAGYQYQNQTYQYQQQQYHVPQQQQAEGKAVYQAAPSAASDRTWPHSISDGHPLQQQYTQQYPQPQYSQQQYAQQGRPTYAADSKQSDSRYSADGKYSDSRAPAKSYK